VEYIVTVKYNDNRTHKSIVEVVNYYNLQRELEKCEIKSFTIKLNPII
jgi:hypothetical protein